ncbi:Protein transport protein Sec24B [Manis javanica]|nr:Protein transport protein Sec24B [Manis javanica]
MTKCKTQRSIALPDGQSSPTKLYMSMREYLEIFIISFTNTTYTFSSQGSSHQRDYKLLKPIFQRAEPSDAEIQVHQTRGTS